MVWVDLVQGQVLNYSPQGVGAVIVQLEIRII
jgi:hypothetical protein